MSTRELVILGCSSQQPTRHRNHGGYFIRWDDYGWLFDPGEGTQRQFILAEVAPPAVTHIFVSHFHGDHCLGVGSMLMRLNLDKVTHPIHCYYPAAGNGREYFRRLRYGTIYHETIQVVEHPITKEGIVEENDAFRIEAYFLDHGIPNLGWRIVEKERRKFDPEKLQALGIRGAAMKQLIEQDSLISPVTQKKISIDEVSWMRKGDVIAVAIDTRVCPALSTIAADARLLLCESTYLEEHRELAYDHYHLTARQAAAIARDSGVDLLVLTHFSARYPDERAFEQEARELFPNAFAARDLKRFALPVNR